MMDKPKKIRGEDVIWVKIDVKPLGHSDRWLTPQSVPPPSLSLPFSTVESGKINPLFQSLLQLHWS